MLWLVFLLLGLHVVQGEAQQEMRRVTLKLRGQSCHAHFIDVESALLHLRNGTMVDIERRKGYVIVTYDSSKMSIAQMLRTVGNQRGEDWSCKAEVVAE